jgi:hypothetical protein
MDLRQTLEIETGYRETNAWLEWEKYCECALNKTNCYACAAPQLENQVVLYPVGLISDPNGVACRISLYQDFAWGNESYKNLLLQFPEVKDPRESPLELSGPIP